MIKILFVCHGNICRSPMAEMVLNHLARQQKLPVEADSAATTDEEIGNGVHFGTRRKLREVGIPCTAHRAVQLTRGDYDRYDYLIGMDQWNLRDMRRIVGGDPKGKCRLMLSFTERGGEVADPWYTGDFDAAYRDILEGCTALIETLRREEKLK